MSNLAILGGPKAIQTDHDDIFKWPIITQEDEEAVLDVLRRGAMSNLDVTMKFEEEFAAWQGRKYALGMSSGTAAVHSAMFGCRVGVGDEVICPSITYWASALPCYSLGATPVFAEIDPVTLCIDPADVERRITDRTKAIVAVHYVGHPCDMDALMRIGAKYNVKIIEDVSHAHGALYKGRKVGSIGDVGAMSLMSAKAIAIGEAGILVTDDREIFERAVAFGHYERFDHTIKSEELRPYAEVPLGGCKYRMSQMSSAVGRVQLKYYDERMGEIQKAMNYFWDLLEGTPGVRAHRTPPESGSTMGGWYYPHGLYLSEEFGGLSVTRFCEALVAEGADTFFPGCNSALHLHPIFSDCDIYGDGKPTRIARSSRDIRQPAGSLPISEGIGKRTFGVPWFKHYRPEVIEEYANALKKVIANHTDLLAGDPGDPPHLGRWHFFGIR